MYIVHILDLELIGLDRLDMWFKEGDKDGACFPSGNFS